MARSTVDVIADAVAPAVASLGLRLYDVELAGTGKARVVRVLVDRDGGVDLDAIARASEVVAPLLDSGSAGDALAGSFTLEVSSPGLERPLRRPEHFRHAVGELVSVKARVADGSARRLRGTLRAATDDSVAIALDDGAYEEVALADVVSARTVFEWTSGRPQGDRPGEDIDATREVARR